MSILMWLESTWFGTFIRESESIWAYPTFSTIHTIGLSIIVGTSAIVAIRLLGFAPTMRLAPLKRLFPFMWFGFAINLFSGSLMAAASARHIIPNPLFITKMTLVLGALVIMRALQVRGFRGPEAGYKPLYRMTHLLT